MKKNFFKRAFIASALCALVIMPAAAFNAEVVSVSGKAQVSLNGGSSWTEIKNGDKIPQGAVIQTAFKSELNLQIKGSSVKLGPMSRVKIDELSDAGDKDNTRISMDVGSLKSNVKKVEDRRAGFTVRGPAATASVRGTEFEYSVSYKGAAVQVSEGSVAVWKSSSPAAASAANAGADTGAVSQNDAPTAENISDGEAPAGAFTVSVGQTASFSDGGKSQAGAAQNAGEAAFDTGAATGSNMAVAERLGGLYGAATNAGFGNGPAGSGARSAKVNVIVSIED